MTTRRRRLLRCALAVAAILGVLALPPVHWRLYGWVKGEPFYAGRPASWWSATLRACDVGECVIAVQGPTLVYERARPPEMCLVPRPTLVDRGGRWLADALSRPPSGPQLVESVLAPSDPAALPVLLALLGDADPRVRYFAAQELGGLGEAGRPALPALRSLAGDPAEGAPGWGATVGAAAAHAVSRLDRPRR
jgi:HEAT repeats